MLQVVSPPGTTEIQSLATESLVVVVSSKPATKKAGRKKSGYRHSDGPVHKDRELRDFLELADRIERDEQNAWNSRMVSVECMPAHPLMSFHYSELERRYGYENNIDSDSSLCQEFLVLSGVSHGGFMTRIPSVERIGESLMSLL